MRRQTIHIGITALRKNLMMVVVVLCATMASHAEYRKWTDNQGRELFADWVGVSEDQSIILKSATTGKLIPIKIVYLSAQDRMFIEEHKSTSNIKRYVKINGLWVQRDQIGSTLKEAERRKQVAKERKAKWEAEKREKEYVAKARAIIREKTPPKAKNARQYGAKILLSYNDDFSVCAMGTWTPAAGSIDSRVGHFNYHSIEPSSMFVCYKPPQADWFRKTFVVKELYWFAESTIDAEGSPRTFQFLTPHEDIAIKFVRFKNGLFEKGDSRFVTRPVQDFSDDGTFGNKSREYRLPQRDAGDSMRPKLAGFGSGFLVTRDGYLVTNSHVIDGATTVKVFCGDKAYPAKIVKVDSDTDIALLKLEGEFVPLKMAANRVERLGRSVFAMGFPQPQYQGFSPKITKGVISAEEGFRGDVRKYQIDAAVQPGNSGGPLADEDGNLVGVVVSRLSVSGSQNVNYAIKKSYLLAFLDSIPECSKGVETAKDAPPIPFEDAVEIVRKSIVQIFVYE